jgi:hypothetical protein
MLFPPDRQHELRTEITTRITAKRNLNPVRHRSHPRVVKRARHNSYPVKRKGDKETRHTGPAVVRLANQTLTTPNTKKPQVRDLSATG